MMFTATDLAEAIRTDTRARAPHRRAQAVPKALIALASAAMAVVLIALIAG